jgi:ATP-dependent Lon protease
VLKAHKKELIEALVTVHVVTSKSTDVVEGKGNGLIIRKGALSTPLLVVLLLTMIAVLHGGPGTGKTLTAESVAEIAEKPLYRVTCGDIGTEAEHVEKYLETVLQIGTNWGCVVSKVEILASSHLALFRNG